MDRSMHGKELVKNWGNGRGLHRAWGPLLRGKPISENGGGKVNETYLRRAIGGDLRGKRVGGR